MQCAQRRGAPKSLDESDFDTAYRHLLAAHQDDWKDRTRKIVAHLCVFLAGALFPYGPMLVAGDSTTEQQIAGVGLCLVTVMLAVGAAIIHEVPLGRAK